MKSAHVIIDICLKISMRESKYQFLSKKNIMFTCIADKIIKKNTIILIKP